jgi:serine protease
MTRAHLVRFVVMAVALASSALAFVTLGAQQIPDVPEMPPAQGGRTVLSDVTASAIDRGLRENDAPRPPSGASGDGLGRPSRGARFLPGSLIVKFRPGTSLARGRAVLALVDGIAEPPPSYANFEIVTIDAGVDPELAAERLAAQPDVEFAQARYRVGPAFVPNDPLYARQWNFPALDMERAWDINPGASAAITVAVLDSGVAFRSRTIRAFAGPWQREDGVIFPALGELVLPFAAAPDLDGPGRFVSPWDFIWGDDSPLDLDGHGTHVAGTIGQLTNNATGGAGMAFGVRLMPVKVIDTDWDFILDSPFIGTDDTVARGIRYAVDNGAKVINMSIGRSGPPAPAVESAIRYAVSRGAFVAVAAGNEFLRDPSPQRLAEFAPAIDGMVSVGAVGRSLGRAFYSNVGAAIELVAPGGDSRQGGTTSMVLQQTLDFDLTETYLGSVAQYRRPRFDAFAYYYLQGTSMATPHVAGFAAMLMQQGITSPAAIEAIMKRFATDLGPTGRDDEYGYGLINPRASLRGLGLAR